MRPARGYFLLQNHPTFYPLPLTCISSKVTVLTRVFIRPDLNRNSYGLETLSQRPGQFVDLFRFFPFSSISVNLLYMHVQRCLNNTSCCCSGDQALGMSQFAEALSEFQSLPLRWRFEGGEEIKSAVKQLSSISVFRTCCCAGHLIPFFFIQNSIMLVVSLRASC